MVAKTSTGECTGAGPVASRLSTISGLPLIAGATTCAHLSCLSSSAKCLDRQMCGVWSVYIYHDKSDWGVGCGERDKG